MENEQIASHSEDVQSNDDAVKSALAAFDLLPPDEPQEQQEPQDDMDEVSDLNENEEPPAIVEPKKLVVKVNKEDREVPEEEIPERVQMSFGLEKERERREKYESALTRAAKLAGYDDVNSYLSNLDTLEQQQLQHKEDSFKAARDKMVEELELAGYNPDQVAEFIDNNPLFQQAQAIIEREREAEAQRQAQQAEQQRVQGWENLLAKYPHLNDEVQPDGTAAWLNADMRSRLERGYDPIDAYELAHRDAITSEQRKLAEQEVLKNQRLNKRAAVLGAEIEDLEPTVPKELTDAFKLFGIDPRAAKKYAKK